MARPRKPLAHHEATGAAKKDPQRMRVRMDEPRPTSPLGDPPARYLNAQSSMSIAKLAIWRELEQQITPGVVTGADRWAFEDACEARYEIRHGDPKKKAQYLAQSRALLAALGMSPVGRTQIAAERAKEADGSPQNDWASRAEGRIPSAIQ